MNSERYERYCRRADECHDRADQCFNASDKKEWLKMAAWWRGCAEDETISSLLIWSPSAYEGRR